MNNNEILQAIDEAWREFENAGEITDSADNLLSAVNKMQRRDRELVRLMSTTTYAGEDYGGMNTNAYVYQELEKMYYR